jgi:actin-related protein
MREGHQGECGILLVEPSYLPTNNIANIRDTVCQHLLDELNIQSVYFLKGSVSTNLAQGTTSGIVVDSGHHFTTVARVHDGYQDSISIFSFGANVIDA